MDRVPAAGVEARGHSAARGMDSPSEQGRPAPPSPGQPRGPGREAGQKRGRSRAGTTTTLARRAWFSAQTAAW